MAKWCDTALSALQGQVCQTVHGGKSENLRLCCFAPSFQPLPSESGTNSWQTMATMDYESLDVALLFASCPWPLKHLVLQHPKPDGWCSRWEARMVLAPKWTTWSWKERKAWHRQVVSPNKCTVRICFAFVLYENIVYIYIHKDTYILKPQKPGGAKFDLWLTRCLEECVGNYASCECFRFRKFPTEAHQNTFEQFGEHKKGGPNVL